MVLGVLAVAGAAAGAAYVIGKRKERRQIANGYITMTPTTGTQQFANIHYGKTRRH